MNRVTRRKLLGASAALAAAHVAGPVASDASPESWSENDLVPIVAQVVAMSDAEITVQTEAAGETIVLPRRDPINGAPQIGDRVVIEEGSNGDQRFASPLLVSLEGNGTFGEGSIQIEAERYALDPDAMVHAGQADPIRLSSLPPIEGTIPIAAYAVAGTDGLRVTSLYPGVSSG